MMIFCLCSQLYSICTVLNACKKNAEPKYKLYKDKLTVKCRKEYYYSLLEKNKNNVKGTWQQLNSLLLNISNLGAAAGHCIHYGNLITNMNDIVNSFNNYFVNIGPELAGKIVQPSSTHAHTAVCDNGNPNSFFLKLANESEIINIVNECKNKDLQIVMTWI